MNRKLRALDLAVLEAVNGGASKAVSRQILADAQEAGVRVADYPTTLPLPLFMEAWPTIHPLSGQHISN
jgi:hypothetical protein